MRRFTRAHCSIDEPSKWALYIIYTLCMKDMDITNSVSLQPCCYHLMHRLNHYRPFDLKFLPWFLFTTIIFFGRKDLMKKKKPQANLYHMPFVFIHPHIKMHRSATHHAKTIISIGQRLGEPGNFMSDTGLSIF